MNREQAARYLARIGYDGPVEPTFAALGDLQERHFYAVPYENLDILAGKRLSLKVDDLYNKVVERRRGGYCFELNPLFGALLESMGFEVTHYFARFLLGESAIPMRRHHVLRVRAQGRDCIADVGVGVEVPRRAYPLERGEWEICGARYRLGERPTLGWVLMDRHGGAWRDLYSFAEEPQIPAVDYAAASFFCERASESIFNKQEMVALKRPGGRVTLDGKELRIFSGEGVQVVTLADEAEKRAALLEYFGLEA